MLAINGAKVSVPPSCGPDTLLMRSQVIINGRREDVLKATAEEINAAAKESQMGGEVIPVQGDVATKQGIVDFHEKASKHLDKVSARVSRRVRQSGVDSTARPAGQQCWLL